MGDEALVSHERHVLYKALTHLISGTQENFLAELFGSVQTCTSYVASNLNRASQYESAAVRVCPWCQKTYDTSSLLFLHIVARHINARIALVRHVIWLLFLAYVRPI